jgi:chromosomal replication initiation ATPase DnaA
MDSMPTPCFEQNQIHTAPHDTDKLKCDRVIAAVSTLLQVSSGEIATARRNARIVHARHVSMYLAHVVLRVAVRHIATSFQRERSTVAYACRKIEEQREETHFDIKLDLIERLICKEGDMDYGR